MNKIIKVRYPQNCIGCELCVLETQRQLKKVGLDEALIRILRHKKDKSEYLEYEIQIDPQVNSLTLELIEKICPKGVFEITKDEEHEL